MKYRRPIAIEKMNRDTEEWEPWQSILYANVNKAANGQEYLEAGAQQSRVSKTFRLRFFPGADDIEHNTQLYRIRYEGHTYDIEDYDDYMERHKEIRLLGVSE